MKIWTIILDNIAILEKNVYNREIKIYSYIESKFIYQNKFLMDSLIYKKEVS